MPSLIAGELPASYGTGKLLLVARDPHWLFAHWDLTDAQLKDYNRLSADGHLVVRVYIKAIEGRPILEQAVHPESRTWFLHVPTASTRYLAELGYYDSKQVWTRVSQSAATITPAEDLSAETWVRFETLPFDIPMSTLVRLVREATVGSLPLLDAIRELQAQGHPELPTTVPGAPGTPWSQEQEAALAKVICMDEVRRVWIGSLEITELLRRQLVRGISSGELPISSLGQVSSLASPFGGEQPGARGFWFNVNAELIVYGATDPKATVRIGGRTIQLRPDGTFSYRFSLPDGEYGLPIRATSPDEVETRSADLKFRRASEYRGDVGTHPQDSRLQTPGPDHVS
ncbi:MAG: DUF4912 domain-containing protein [Verrucomicrobiales bacterium]|nr:DUF4912 domain-containing protein [Verrucomicrobiales bacterium]